MSCVNKTIIDLRREPSTRSERISQALFGTRVKELLSEGEWRLVETPDGYQGFVEERHLVKEPATTKGACKIKVKEAIVSVWDLECHSVITRLAFDTRLQATVEGDRLIIRLFTGEEGYIPKEAAIPTTTCEDMTALGDLARSFVGTPYLWGGISPFGFDCSGFVQRLFHYCFNYWLPRDTVDQRKIGGSVSVGEVALGDLCFFPGHVALYLENGWIIHANRHHNGVSVDQLIRPVDAYAERLLADLEDVRRVSLPPVSDSN
jgi:hypothetical protein